MTITAKWDGEGFEFYATLHHGHVATGYQGVKHVLGWTKAHKRWSKREMEQEARRHCERYTWQFERLEVVR